MGSDNVHLTIWLSVSGACEGGGNLTVTGDKWTVMSLDVGRAIQKMLSDIVFPFPTAPEPIESAPADEAENPATTP